MLRFLRLIRKFDRLGHKFSLNYKGEDMFQTILGSLLTIASTVLVGILFVHKITEVIDMKDPTVQVQSQPFKKEEVNGLGAINLGEHYFNIGVQFHYKKPDENHKWTIKVPFDIPEYVGSFTVVNTTDMTYTPTINCTRVFNDVNEEFGEREQ